MNPTHTHTHTKTEIPPPIQINNHNSNNNAYISAIKIKNRKKKSLPLLQIDKIEITLNKWKQQSYFKVASPNIKNVASSTPNYANHIMYTTKNGSIDFGVIDITRINNFVLKMNKILFELKNLQNY